MKPTVVSPEELAQGGVDLQPRVALAAQFVPTVQGNCEMISGDSPAGLADRLVQRLREDRILQ